MTKNILDDILLYNMLGWDADRDSGINNPPAKTLEDLNAFLKAKFSDKPEVLARIENLPGNMEKKFSQFMLNDGKSLEEIADWLKQNSDFWAHRDAMRSAKAAASSAGRALEELGWPEEFARRMGRAQAMSGAFGEAIRKIDATGSEHGFDFSEYGEMAAIRFHLNIPPEGISLYEAYESMTITDEWPDGQVHEIDVVRHIQEIEAGIEPSQTGFAIELAAKLRAAIDSGADPDMSLEDAMQLREIMEPFEPKPAGPSEVTLERMERFEQKIQEMNQNSSAASPPKFEM